MRLNEKKIIFKQNKKKNFYSLKEIQKDINVTVNTK